MILVPATAIFEDATISIADEPEVRCSSSSDIFRGKLDVIKARIGAPTTNDKLHAVDWCEISGPDESSNEGMTIIALNGSSVVVLHYLDDQLLVEVHDDE